MDRERQTNQRNTVILQINKTDTILIYSFYLHFIYVIKLSFGLFYLSVPGYSLNTLKALTVRHCYQ